MSRVIGITYQRMQGDRGLVDALNREYPRFIRAEEKRVYPELGGHFGAVWEDFEQDHTNAKTRLETLSDSHLYLSAALYSYYNGHFDLATDFMVKDLLDADREGERAGLQRWINHYIRELGRPALNNTREAVFDIMETSGNYITLGEFLEKEAEDEDIKKEDLERLSRGFAFPYEIIDDPVNASKMAAALAYAATEDQLPLVRSGMAALQTPGRQDFLGAMKMARRLGSDEYEEVVANAVEHITTRLPGIPASETERREAFRDYGQMIMAAYDGPKKAGYVEAMNAAFTKTSPILMPTSDEMQKFGKTE